MYYTMLCLVSYTNLFSTDSKFYDNDMCVIVRSMLFKEYVQDAEPNLILNETTQDTHYSGARQFHPFSRIEQRYARETSSMSSM